MDNSEGDISGITRCPSETLLNIFRFLTATDVLCSVRQVSKIFRDLSCDIGLWRSLYANACVPRPPGPFPWQTYDALRDILLRSEQLDRTWTSQPCKVVQMDDPFYLDWIGICSRIVELDRLWFARAKSESNYELVCYSFKRGFHSVIWKWDRPFLIGVCLDMSVEGQAVFIFVMDQSSEAHAKLLKCKIDDDEIMPVSASWDIPSLGVRYAPFVFFSRASTVYLDGNFPLIFDTVSCRFYQIPVHSRSGDFTPCFLRRTQLLWIDLRESTDLRFQVFALPESGTGSFPPDSESIPKLRLTHEMIVPQKSSCSISPLVYPPLGLATQPTQFKLLMRSFTSRFRGTATYECLTIALPGSSLLSSNNVLPLSMRTQTLFTVNTPGAALYVSEDGHARGLWEETPHNYQKFSIDASGDVCHTAVGEWTSVSHFERAGLVISEVDCLRGKVYCRKSVSSGEELVVVDIE